MTFDLNFNPADYLSELVDPDPLRTFQIIYPCGEIVEFDAKISEFHTEPGKDGGTSLSLPLTVRGTVRTGSIYDREGSD